jgi:hypothetical protein
VTALVLVAAPLIPAEAERNCRSIGVSVNPLVPGTGMIAATGVH